MGTASSQPVVSIVIATYNRRDRLQRCIAGIRANVGIPHEIVAVGGASDDGTSEWLAARPD
ncbi:MAG TPA: glycosyltransferase, partial [Phycisphaerae bacterium]|nr:glycosyltransferase [Phycisphaerae bacterium]